MYFSSTSILNYDIPSVVIKCQEILVKKHRRMREILFQKSLAFYRLYLNCTSKCTFAYMNELSRSQTENPRLIKIVRLLSKFLNPIVAG